MLTRRQGFVSGAKGEIKTFSRSVPIYGRDYAEQQPDEARFTHRKPHVASSVELLRTRDKQTNTAQTDA